MARTLYYAGDFVGNYARTRAGNYTGNYSRTRVTDYTGNFVGNYGRTRAGNYTGNYARTRVTNYAGNFVGNYTRGVTYTGNYSRNVTYTGNYARDVAYTRTRTSTSTQAATFTRTSTRASTRTSTRTSTGSGGTITNAYSQPTFINPTAPWTAWKVIYEGGVGISEIWINDVYQGSTSATATSVTLGGVLYSRGTQQGGWSFFSVFRSSFSLFTKSF